MPTTTRPILICRVAWMNRYRGLEDRVHSNARYVREHGFGHEIYNFLPSRGIVHGFVQFFGSMRIERLGARPEDESVDPVTVVWTAPRKGGGVYVVGWYKNAKVHRSVSKEPNDNRWKMPGRSGVREWLITAKAKDVRCLDPDDRWFKIPDSFVSQSLFNYITGANKLEERLLTRLHDLIAGRLRPTAPKAVAPRQHDHDRLVRIEKAAIDTVRRYYTQKGYDVRSVEKDRLGWDLEAVRLDDVLRIEVKGCSGPDVAAELTPNEYHQSRQHRDRYRICIVTNSLRKPTLHAFTWSNDRDAWCEPRGKALTIEERLGAVLRVG